METVHRQALAEAAANSLDDKDVLLMELEEEEEDVDKFQRKPAAIPVPGSSIKTELRGQPKYAIQIQKDSVTGKVSATASWLGGGGHLRTSNKDTNPHQTTPQVHPSVVRGFAALYCDKQWRAPRDTRLDGEGITIQCWTTMKREDLLIRAHPRFYTGKPWYDWAMIRCYDISSSDNETKSPNNQPTFDSVWNMRKDLPCKIMSIVKMPLHHLPLTHTEYKVLGNSQDEKWATFLLVIPTQYQLHSQARALRPPSESLLVTQCFLELDHSKPAVPVVRNQSTQVLSRYPKMELFSIDTYVDECLVIQEHPGLYEVYTDDPIVRGCLLVKNRDRHWTSCFEQHYGMLDNKGKEHEENTGVHELEDTDGTCDTPGEDSSTSSGDSAEMGLLQYDYL